MTFVFRAHQAAAYWKFAVSLFLIISLNLLAIYFTSDKMKEFNDAVLSSVILVIPWIFLLFLPSFLAGIIIYNSFVKTYQIEIDKTGLMITISSGKMNAGQLFLWDQVKGYRFTDFEDNHYFRIHFKDLGKDLIIHRDTGDFELFFEELRKHCTVIDAAGF